MTWAQWKKKHPVQIPSRRTQGQEAAGQGEALHRRDIGCPVQRRDAAMASANSGSAVKYRSGAAVLTTFRPADFAA